MTFLLTLFPFSLSLATNINYLLDLNVKTYYTNTLILLI